MSTPTEKLIVQRNKRTGQSRVSTDGGKTWHPVESAPTAPVPPISAAKPTQDRGTPPPVPTTSAEPKSDAEKAIEAEIAKAEADAEQDAQGLFVRGEPLRTEGRGTKAPLTAASERLTSREEVPASSAFVDALLGTTSFGLNRFGRAEDRSGATSGPAFDAELQNINQQLEDARIDQPGASLAGDMVGSIPHMGLGGVAKKMVAPLAKAGPAIAERGTAFVRSLLESGALGGLEGMLQGAGHADSIEEAPGKALVGAGMGTAAGVGVGGALEATVNPAIRAAGRKAFQRRQSPLESTGVATQEAAAVGAEPTYTSQGGIKPGPVLEPRVEAAQGKGMLASDIEANKLASMVDDEATRRMLAGEHLFPQEFAGTTAADIEQNRVALALRDAMTDKANASKAEFDSDLAMSAFAESGQPKPMATAKEAAEEMTKKYTQEGGKLPDAEDVATKKLLLGSADEVDARTEADVNDMLDFVRDEDAFDPASDAAFANAERMAAARRDEGAAVSSELRSEADKLVSEPKDAELLYSPIPQLREFAAKFPDVLDSEKLQTQIDLVQHRRKAAQAAKSPEQSSLAKLEEILIKLREEHFPQTHEAVTSAHQRLSRSEASRDVLGTGKSETFDKSISFGPEVDALVSKVMDPSVNAGKALREAIGGHPNEAEIYQAINRARENVRLQQEGKMISPKDREAGEAARQLLGDAIVEQGKIARGMKGYEQARDEELPIGLGAGRGMVRIVRNRAAAMKNKTTPKVPPMQAAAATDRKKKK